MGRGWGSGRVVVVVVVDTCRSGNVHHESRSEQAVHAKCPETHISVSGILVELFFSEDLLEAFLLPAPSTQGAPLNPSSAVGDYDNSRFQVQCTAGTN